MLQCKQLALKVQICSFSDKYCICNTCDCGSCLFLQPLYTIRDMIEVDKDAKHLKKQPISAIYYSSTRLIPEVSDNKQECISFRLLQLKHLRCWQNLYLNLRLRKTRGLEMYYLQQDLILMSLFDTSPATKTLLTPYGMYGHTQILACIRKIIVRHPDLIHSQILVMTY